MVLLDLKMVGSIPGKSENQQIASEDTATLKQTPTQQQKFCQVGMGSMSHASARKRPFVNNLSSTPALDRKKHVGNTEL